MLHLSWEFIIFIFDIVNHITDLAQSDVLVFQLVSLLLQKLLVVKTCSVLELSFLIFISWIVCSTCKTRVLHLATVSYLCCSTSSHCCRNLNLKLFTWCQESINSFYSLLFFTLRYSIINIITFLIKIN